MAGNLSPEPWRVSFLARFPPSHLLTGPSPEWAPGTRLCPLVGPLPEAPCCPCQSYLERLPSFTAGSAQASWTVLGVQGSLGSPLPCVPSSWVRGLSAVFTDKAGLTLPPYLPWAPL